MNTTPGATVSQSIRDQREALGGPALIPYITAGFPSKAAFGRVMEAIAPQAAVIEVGVPFSDPMADGVTIQRTSRIALEQSVTLQWILEQIALLRTKIAVPIVLMGYLNPFLQFGIHQLAKACAAAGVQALIIPDMPLEESGEFRDELHAHGVGLVQFVSPVTSPDRATRLATSSDGFLYAVTGMGVTGGSAPLSFETDYPNRLRASSPVPVCAGFGIRTATDIALLGHSVDGVIVGSALAEAIEAGYEPASWLRSLRGQRESN